MDRVVRRAAWCAVASSAVSPGNDDRPRDDAELGGQPTTPSGWGAASASPDPAPPGPPPPVPPPPVAPKQYYIPADAVTGPPSHDQRRDPSDAPPAAGPGVRTDRRPKRRQRRTGRIVGIASLALVGLVVSFMLFGVYQFFRMERVDVGYALSGGAASGTNYLIVGSDSRDGFDPTNPNAGAVLGDGTADDPTERSDTMLILRVSGDGAKMLSIPRDLWVRRANGSEGRINASYRDGPEALIQTVVGLGIPVHHYVEVDFVTFAGLVDAVGGVTIDIPHPARDTHSGLDLPVAGPADLDGTQALAYVRSRRYTELIDGSWRTDPTGDLGRVQRQQLFLRSVMSEVGGTRNPIELMRVSSALADGLRIDNRMGLFDALRFARSLRGLEPESVELPVFPFTTSGGAAVLGLRQPEAEAVIAQFR